MAKNILVVEKILSANDRIASENREIFDAAGVKAFNLMASPGAGKTSLIEQTVKRLLRTMKLAVIDGDIATNIDADRAQAAGALAIQINTGGQCHSRYG
jgi:hydrogenase nickel incorporation protein HypB